MSKKMKKVISANPPPKAETKKKFLEKKPSWKDFTTNEFYLSNPLTVKKDVQPFVRAKLTWRFADRLVFLEQFLGFVAKFPYEAV